MIAQWFAGVEASEVPWVDVGNTGRSGLAQRAKTCRVLGFLPLDKPDALTQDLAGVLVPAGHDQSLDEPSLMVGQDDVACWHDSPGAPCGKVCQMTAMYTKTDGSIP